MSVRYDLHPNLPAEVRDAVLPILVANEHILPTWCRVLIVKWSRTRSERKTAALCDWEHKYRRAKLTICASWLEHPPEERENVIRHELVHVAVGPLVDTFRALLEATVYDDDHMKAWAEKLLEDAMEGVTEDLTVAFAEADAP